MIAKIEIQNFQSHKNTIIDLTEGVNIIVGTTDSGKTAIIRALLWLFFNTPSGNAFRSWWGGDTVVKITLDDGVEVSRIKRDKEDLYVIKKPGKKAKELKAFGMKVPEAVTELLNINDINIQQQLDTPFLLSETPGKVAQFFNKVIKLDKIDTGIQNINKLLREINGEIKYDTKALEEKQELLKQFANIPTIQKGVVRLEKMEQESMRQSQMYMTLRGLISDIKDCDVEIERCKHVEEMEETFLKLENKITEKKDKKESIAKLKHIVGTLTVIEIQEGQFKGLEQHEQQINQISIMFATVKEKKMSIETLNGLLNTVHKVEKQSVRKSQDIDDMEKAFHENMPDMCPLCGEQKRK